MTTNESPESSHSRSVLLAGAGGVLGRHLTRALTEAGHKVTYTLSLHDALPIYRKSVV